MWAPPEWWVSNCSETAHCILHRHSLLSQRYRYFTKWALVGRACKQHKTAKVVSQHHSISTVQCEYRTYKWILARVSEGWVMPFHPPHHSSSQSTEQLQQPAIHISLTVCYSLHADQGTVSTLSLIPLCSGSNNKQD